MYDLEHRVGRWTSVLYRYRKAFMIRRLEEFGAVGGTFMTFLTINWMSGSSQEQISDYLKFDKTTTAKAIKKLENEGYVRRETDGSDKRVNRVYVTPKGKEIVPEVQAALLEWEAIVSEGISEADYSLAEKTLHRMTENACRKIHENKEQENK